MSEELALIDIEDGTKRMMGNEALFKKLLEKFKEDKNFEKTLAAIRDKNWGEAKTAAHTFKGVASNLSLKELTAQFIELENKIKAEAVDSDFIEKIILTNTRTMEEIDKIIAK